MLNLSLASVLSCIAWACSDILSASNVLIDAERLTAAYPNATPSLVDMSDLAAVERLVAEADIVIRFGFVIIAVSFALTIGE